MNFSYAETFGGQNPEAYERLLLNALEGDATSDVPALARGELKGLLARVEARQGAAEETTARHLSDVAARIKLALERVKVEGKPGGQASGRNAFEFSWYTRGEGDPAAPTSCFPE